MSRLLDGLQGPMNFEPRPAGMEGFEAVLWEASDAARAAAFMRLDGDSADTMSGAALQLMAKEDAVSAAIGRLARLVQHPDVLRTLAQAMALEGVEAARYALGDRVSKAVGMRSA